ncbi:MAG: SDR family oxidoreductase [Coriobacteriia bacterium]
MSLRIDYRGTRALVTGGTRGIGRAIAEAFLERGTTVVVTGTGADAPEWVAHREGCSYARLDWLDEACAAAFLGALPDIGPFDVLVNNAGIHAPRPIDDLDLETWRRVIAVDLEGPARLTAAVAREMRERGSGRVLNVASIAAFVSRPGGAAYAAAKAGLVGLTRAAALDLAPYGVLVNALCPGYTATDMAQRTLTAEQREDLRRAVPLDRLAQPAEIASVALFLCSGLNTYVTGQTVTVDGGVTAA